MSTSQALYIAPRHVYAGIISNKTNEPVLCTIYYSSKANNHLDESISVKLDSGGRACIPEREYQPTPEATFNCRKIVSRIDVQANEQSFSLEQPFDGVTCPVTEWKFDIHNEHIASINPNVQA
ncbi:unnamed protein product [Rotaria sordida]|uniref:Uncharacterized protein n=1 Tax=Rotaria sordida TaxID=392033 RepID=A0A814YAV3_9BILA|nr:unnamed protein product [Rotaria sordida]CAF0965880.1 unnamed protein product [Rotaria sordida]CAF1076746.1 unnamed protein product [Rotaria sordida]CAF1158598.1 unnamed protein product [Rotaria sordida]CAF1177897.1 unnamed protein product [Rotaria sordida]